MEVVPNYLLIQYKRERERGAGVEKRKERKEGEGRKGAKRGGGEREGALLQECAVSRF